MRKKILGTMFLLLFCVFIIGCIISKNTKKIEATPKDEDKYFTYIVVEEGDTLWEIAQEHMDRDHYSSVYEYMKELKRMNNMTSDTVYAGEYFIITYFE